jgi:cytochrome P450
VRTVFRNLARGAERAEVFARVQLRDSDPALAADYIRISSGMMFVKDGQDHHRLRVLGSRAFTLLGLQRWLPRVERVVDELIEAVMPAGRMDLIGDLAGPLPAIVIAELFGIAPEDRETFHRWSMAFARFFGGSGSHQCLGMNLGRRELEISLGRLVQRMPRLRLDKERPMRRRMDSLALRGLASLPVRFD